MASPEPNSLFIPNPKARLFDQVREVMRFHHYSLRTEKGYVQSIRRFLVFHRGRSGDATAAEPGPAGLADVRPGKWRHPREMGAAEVTLSAAEMTESNFRGRTTAMCWLIID